MTQGSCSMAVADLLNAPQGGARKQSTIRSMVLDTLGRRLGPIDKLLLVRMMVKTMQKRAATSATLFGSPPTN